MSNLEKTIEKKILLLEKKTAELTKLNQEVKKLKSEIDSLQNKLILDKIQEVNVPIDQVLNAIGALKKQSDD